DHSLPAPVDPVDEPRVDHFGCDRAARGRLATLSPDQDQGGAFSGSRIPLHRDPGAKVVREPDEIDMTGVDFLGQDLRQGPEAGRSPLVVPQLTLVDHTVDERPAELGPLGDRYLNLTGFTGCQ